jgi:Amt family ammonium transporter
MVTADDRDDKVVGALEVGATDFIPKSLSQAVVRARVRNVIRIRSRQRRVEAATEAKARFLANMSHEIRTPMTAILGFADLLSSEDVIESSREEHASAIQAIKRNGEHLLELINDILDLSKVEAGKLRVERIRCSAVQVVTDVVSTMRVKANEKGLPLEIEFHGPIPETIHTDPTRLRQILVNVLSNAVKFTSAGGVRVALSLVRNDRGEPALEIEVADSGIGMSDRQLAEVFKPFSQAETYTTRKYGGTGLGLSITKHLAELLEGSIGVRSKPEVGSTFTIRVATGSLEEVVLLENLTETQFMARREERETALTQKMLHCRVLLAEDGADNQRLLSFLLRKAGAEVTVAENGAVAIDLVSSAAKKNESYDVILMDMQMPVMDGYTATQKLRAEGYAGPIVALTARAMQGDRESCLGAGCDDYMTKPIEREKLLALVAKHVGRTCKEASLDQRDSGALICSPAL